MKPYLPLCLLFLLIGICQAAPQLLITANVTSLPKAGGSILLTAAYYNSTPPYYFRFYSINSTGAQQSFIGSTASSNSPVQSLKINMLNGVHYYMAQGFANAIGGNSTNIVEVITSPAFASSFTSNANHVEIGQNVVLAASASGGFAPYFFVLYRQNMTTGAWKELQAQSNASAVTFKLQPPIGNDIYFAKISDATGNYTYTTNTPVWVNKTGTLYLSPSYSVIEPWSSITFKNTSAGGEPPYHNYSYAVSGGAYWLDNNTVAFNGLGEYNVTLHAFDSLGIEANGSTAIYSAYLPSIIQEGSCYLIANLSQTEEFSLNFSGIKVRGIENFITPDYAGVTLNGNSITLYPQEPYGLGGFYATLNSISWLPILITINLTVCSGSLVTASTSTSSSSTLSTSSTTMPTSSTISISTTTTVPASSTTLPSNSMQKQPQSNQALTVIIMDILVVVLVLTFSAWSFERKKRRKAKT